MFFKAAFCFVLLFLLRRFLKHRRAAALVKFLPGYRTLLPRESFIGNLLPAIPGITVGGNFLFLNGHKKYEYFGWDIHSLISLWPVSTALYLADAAAIKEVMSARARFPKPVYLYESLSFFGYNIVAAEHDLWKKYRKITAPAFSEVRNNKLVWDESIRILLDLVDNVWKNKDVVTVDDCLAEMTMPLALYVIGSAGFGRRISWVEDTQIPVGHKMKFKDALRIVSTGIFIKLAIPKLFMKVVPAFRTIDLAFNELRAYMNEMITGRLNSEKVERDDLFSNLLQANNEDAEDERLSADELIGNIYIFFVAGHETTANTICFALALLALHPEIQEQLFQHNKDQMPNGKPPTYEQMPQLTFALAVIYETMRMYPPVTGIPKYSAEDTTLTTSNSHNEKFTFPVPKGTLLVIDTPGLHYNARYWKDPYEFKPSRFLEDWDRDAFAPFSIGSRACLGRRFAEMESVAVLCTVVSRYKIEVKDDPKFVGESFTEKKARVLDTKAGLTLTHTDCEKDFCLDIARFYPLKPLSRIYFLLSLPSPLEGTFLGITEVCLGFQSNPAVPLELILSGVGYGRIGWDVHSVIAAWPVSITLYLADAAAIKEVTSARVRFPKPIYLYDTLTFFGHNIIATEHDLWKKYRKIAAPAFSERNNKLVWDESIRILLDLVENVWKDKKEIVVDDCLAEITTPLALYIIGSAGFGRKISWKEDTQIPLGHSMKFKDALRIVSTGVFIKLAVPKLLMKLVPAFRTIDLAFSELRAYMNEMIEERLNSEKVERDDLFSNLLEANNEDTEEERLSTDELIGNIYIFFVAGHETTANTICFALALLALHPEIQETLFQHIKEQMPDGKPPSYEQMPRLIYALAVIYEALRMYPPVTGIPKYSAEDTTLTTSNLQNEKFTFPVPKGTLLIIDTPGLHYNARYWKDPHEFNPSRFLGDWDRDAFAPFSIGARACLGRRFAEMESVAVLCTIVSRFKIEVKDDPKFARESFAEKKARVLATKPGLTLTPVNVPLVFKRRN
ncbi:hypothetical protein AMATHDRAFT_40534 [Amanita thiersii Skay4041]|uniref:Cytochrome P450 n=1 Tax=Amanita thiersii Skay4041 TaxID=703135 RepID=A0A2A9NRG4_9AGAR|nr:hypothetical protein AMATHDRAFT_40534 [Amanita thiersii Skay4041]